MSNFRTEHYSPDTNRYFAAVVDCIRENPSEAAWFRDTDRRFGALNESASDKHNAISARTLTYWAKRGLVPRGGGHRHFSFFDIAMTQILVVLRRRGIALKNLATIKKALDGIMLPDPQMTFWEFAVNYVGSSLNVRQHKMGDLYLVINGDNKCAFARAEDLPALVVGDTNATPDSPSTYSHLVLNLNRILHNCNFIEKIGHSAEYFIKNQQRGMQQAQ
jgi:hypothetical protein